jgi:hypothetical protein
LASSLEATMTDAKTDDAKTYQGGCHCGRIRYEVTGDLSQAFDCNCSICIKRGALWGFVKAPQFKLVQGDDALNDYQFGKKKIHHLFCQSCGVGSFSRGLAPNGEETFAINVNCLDGVDVGALKVTPFDGRKL